MSDSAQLAILKSGVLAWNRWRVENPAVRPNLRGADLQSVTLERVNLHDAYLVGANFSHAFLFEADFQAANLRGANLSRCCLIGANLHSAYLANATLHHAYLAETDLSNAHLGHCDLRDANLHGALLSSAYLSQADLRGTDLTGVHEVAIAHLRTAQNLDLAILDNNLHQQLNPRLPAAAAPPVPALPDPLAQTDGHGSSPIPD